MAQKTLKNILNSLTLREDGGLASNAAKKLEEDDTEEAEAMVNDGEMDADEKAESEVEAETDAGSDFDEIMEEAEEEGQLAVDVYETDESVVIRSTIAGVKPDDLDIEVEGNLVTISGKRDEHREVTDDNYMLQECYWGSFARSVELPVEIDPEAIDAELKDGILTVTLPKVAGAKPQKVQVRGN